MSSISRYRPLICASIALFCASCQADRTLDDAATIPSAVTYAVRPAAGSEKVIYSFKNGADGAVPMAGLIADGGGNLYGTATNVGGVGSCNIHCGVVFELSPPIKPRTAWKFSSLHAFTGGADGGLPNGNVIFGPGGSLYGTANVGGGHTKFGAGVVFQLKPSGSRWTEKVLHRFGAGKDGRNPHGGLVADENGNLYGTTSGGGALGCTGGCGVVYELSPAAQGGLWTETILHTFGGGGDGLIPIAGLAIDRAGRLFGTTQYGGHYSQYCQGGCGSVFELTPPSSSGGQWTYATINRFAGGVPGDGALPYDPVVLDNAGNVYGTTFINQGAGGGTAFELIPSNHGETWTENVLYRFPESSSDAGNPKAGFIFDRAGNLYATSEEGGTGFQGTIFRLIPPAILGGAWSDAVLFSFRAVRHGATYPATNLVFGAGGLLYGTTQYGGTGSCVFTRIKGCGTVFEFKQ
ncbi:MAG: choice-of-anchor tandem repeat GloVer-containing protein [Candidatus Tumulicola sp.]